MNKIEQHFTNLKTDRNYNEVLENVKLKPKAHLVLKNKNKNSANYKKDSEIIKNLERSGKTNIKKHKKEAEIVLNKIMYLTANIL